MATLKEIPQPKTYSVEVTEVELKLLVSGMKLVKESAQYAVRYRGPGSCRCGDYFYQPGRFSMNDETTATKLIGDLTPPKV